MGLAFGVLFYGFRVALRLQLYDYVMAEVSEVESIDSLMLFIDELIARYVFSFFLYCWCGLTGCFSVSAEIHISLCEQSDTSYFFS